jgi:5-methyltetrahydropteroyltriglutamate--homocysteine methyltransferase
MVEGTQAPGLICDPHELQLRRFNFSLRGNEETTPSQTKEFRRRAECFFAADWGAHMTMQQNTDRIQTTHIGSLPRPHRLLDALKAKYSGQPYDEAAFRQALRAAVADVVRKQVDCGLDIITDGEFSKPGFFTYIRERLAGFESRPNAKFNLFEQEVAAFPEYYEQYFKQAMMGGTVVSLAPVVCVGPVKYRGEKLVKIDIDNMIAAAAAAGVAKEHVFLPATAPSGVGKNEYYKSDEEYFHALAAEMSKEYRAILEAGILVQIDDPFLPDIFFEPGLDDAQKKRRAQIYVEAINTALKGISPEYVRFHTCYGINEGPRIYEAALKDIIEYVLQINAGSYSFEAANPRHEHEYHLFEQVKVPDGKVLVPGVITHASNIVEHPELIAERIMRFAHLVGRENVIAGADCGFSSQALYNTEVHPTVVWEKFKAMREGANIATQRLWA